MTERKVGSQFYKLVTVALTVFILAAVIIGIIIYQGRRAEARESYLSEGGAWLLELKGDGSFDLSFLPGDKLGIADPHAPKDQYRWDGETLVLEYGASESVLYFQKDGDHLIFQEGQSAVSGNVHLLDKTIFKILDNR